MIPETHYFTRPAGSGPYVPAPMVHRRMQTPPGFQFMFDTALQSDFLFWAAPRLARQTVISAILATPPAVVRARRARRGACADCTVLEHILPISPRRLGQLNDAAVYLLIASLRT